MADVDSESIHPTYVLKRQLVAVFQEGSAPLDMGMLTCTSWQDLEATVGEELLVGFLSRWKCHGVWFSQKLKACNELLLQLTGASNGNQFAFHPICNFVQAVTSILPEETINSGTNFRLILFG